MFTDASGSCGCSTLWNKLWLQLEWAGILQDAHIVTKELTIWGSQWKGRSVKVLSDNSAAMAAINKQSSRVPMMAHLLKALAFICGRFQIQLGASHLPGTHNCAADAISRNNVMLFYSLLLQASRFPTRIPSSLLELLLLEKPDWTSPRWWTLWSSTFPLA